MKKDLADTVRSLISPDEVKTLLRHIAQWDGKPKKYWKARADAHQAAIAGGDPFEYGKVAKELSWMESNDELRPRDKANLAQSLNLLDEEIAKSLKKPTRQARKLIRDVLVN